MSATGITQRVRLLKNDHGVNIVESREACTYFSPVALDAIHPHVIG